jgi:hypothetical protein
MRHLKVSDEIYRLCRELIKLDKRRGICGELRVLQSMRDINAPNSQQ